MQCRRCIRDVIDGYHEVYGKGTFLYRLVLVMVVVGVESEDDPPAAIG